MISIEIIKDIATLLELFLVIPEYEIGWRLYKALENSDT